MVRLPLNVVTFAEQTGGNTDFYEAFGDYYNHYMHQFFNKTLGTYDDTVSFEEKDDKIYKAFMKEIQRVSGQDMSTFSEAVMASNPMVGWAAFAISNQAIETILPLTVIDSIGIYTDIRNIGFGDSAQFDIEPRALMTISQSSNSQRTTFIQKQFKTTKTLVPVNHAITVQVSLYAVLARKESLAEFTRKAVISMETEPTRDAYSAFRAGMNAVTIPSALSVTGYTAGDLVTLCETVQAYNQGMKPVIVGTTRALMNILPNGADGYRIITDTNNISIQLIRNFFGYDILVLPQVATGEGDYSLQLVNDEIYVLSPTSDKLVKCVIEGETLTNSNDFYDNANLTSNATFNKRWACEFLSNATAGILHTA